MTLWHFLVCLIFTSCQVAGQSTIYALKGREVNFKPNITGRPDAILWRHNGKIVVEFDGQVEEVNSRYKNRIILDWHNAELDIKDLRFEDSGDYELRRYTEVLQRFHYKLEVLDLAAKPTISCEMNDGGSSNKSGTLLCSAEPRQPQSLMRFEWRLRGKVQPGTKLTISLGGEYDDEVYSCRVSNPLSKETATFTAKDCYPENESVLIGIPVAIAITLSLLLSLFLVGLGIICCKKHNKACFTKGNRHDPENQKHPGSDENTADEHIGLIDRTPTMPSTQRLIQGIDRVLQDEWPKRGSVRSIIIQLELSADGEASPRTSVAGDVRIKVNHSESSHHGETPPITFPAGSQRNKDRNKSPPPDLNNLASNEKGDADEDQLRESAETEDPQCENTPEPAVVLTNTISSTAAEQSESDKETAEDDEKRPPLETTPTPLTTQPRNHVGDLDNVKDKNKDENEETRSPPSTPRSESHSPLDPSNPASNDNGDADADRLSEPVETEVPHRDSSDSEEENEPEPADVSVNTMSDLELSSAPEHEDLEKDEDGNSPPENVHTPVRKLRSQFTQTTPNTAPEVTAGGQKEDANLDHVNGETDTSGVGETTESGSSGEDEQLSPVSEQKDSETKQHDQDPNLTQSETHTSEDNQQEMDKPVPAAEKESGSEGNSEEPNLYSASSHQPQSSTPKKTDNRSNDTFKVSPDAEHGEPSQQGEGKTTKESEESGESEDDTGEDKK